MGYSPWGHKELDTTEQLSTHTTQTLSQHSGDITLGTPRRSVVRALCFHCSGHQIDPWSVGKLKFHMMHGLAKRKKKGRERDNSSIITKCSLILLPNQPSFSNTTFKHTSASLVAQMVKHQPAMQETWVLSLCQEDSLEKGMGTHSSIFAWRIPWTEEPVGL